MLWPLCAKRAHSVSCVLFFPVVLVLPKETPQSHQYPSDPVPYSDRVKRSILHTTAHPPASSRWRV